MRGLTGKVALVTGGAAGVGYSVVERLREEGARVAIIDKDETALLRAAAAFEGSASFAIDVLDERQVQAVVADIASTLGPLDILINNVGRTRFETFDDLDVERWRAEIDLNLTGSYIVTRAALPVMVERRAGAIVNVASVNALVSVGNPAYSAAKAGLIIRLTWAKAWGKSRGAAENWVCHVWPWPGLSWNRRAPADYSPKRAL